SPKSTSRTELSGAFGARRIIGRLHWLVPGELGVLGYDPGLLHQVEDRTLPLDPLLGQVCAPMFVGVGLRCGVSPGGK
ncbi:MAG TPA: hypothetical protein VHM94_04635, partial [Acidimicrobiia bacterium]|nr:hypothetical protein [Acidimicrobiia bacterium]